MPEEEDKKLEYLKRDEVKTMQKDVAALREVEAKQEREKISHIKTAEEVQREQAREIEAQKSAEERKLAEEAAVKREEEMKRMREERKNQEAILDKEGIVRQEEKAEGFKEVMKETQIREEGERKRFLERVAAKAENLPVGTQDEIISPPLSPIATPKKEIPKSFFKRPSLFQKLSVRIVLIILSLAIIAALVSFWYWYLNIREKPVPLPVTEIKEELIIPAALITTEASKTIEISTLGQVLTEDLGDQPFTRLVIENPVENKVLGLKEFFEFFVIKTPETFYDRIDNDFTLFVYSAQSVNRLGLIAQVKDPYLSPLIKTWESTLEQDLEPVSTLLGKAGPSLTLSFKEATYKDAVFRYISFPPENLGICWALTGNYFILTFSGESMIKTIDRIKIGDEAATSSSTSFLLK